MSTDVKVFNACNHVVNGERYTQNTCPLCKGKSYYKDIAFDNNGKAVLCTGEIKLQQEILKIMDDPKGGNKFHINWGDELITNNSHAMLGSKNLPLVAQRIRIIIYETMVYLKNVQVNNQVLFKNMSEEEIIDQIVSIDVDTYSPVGFIVNVKFSNLEGEIFTQQIIL